MPSGRLPVQFAKDSFNKPPTCSATESGRLHSDVSVAAETTTDFPSLTILDTIFLEMILLIEDMVNKASKCNRKSLLSEKSSLMLAKARRTFIAGVSISDWIGSLHPCIAPGIDGA